MAYGITSTWIGQDTEWKESYNWTNGVPKNAGDVAQFSRTTGETLVAIKEATSLGQLQFNIAETAHPITLETFSAVLTFNNNSSDPSIELSTANLASHEIEATIALTGTKNLHIANNSGVNIFLTFTRSLPSGSDLNFIFDGVGIVRLADLSASNYSLQQGNLSLLGNPSGSTMSSLAISNGRTVFIQPGVTIAIDSLSGRGRINVPINAVVRINSGSLSGQITGAGSLEKTSAGTLTITGSNNYTGGTTVSGGILSGTTTGLQGGISVASGTTVDFDQNTDGTYSGSGITGQGSLTKNGAGKVTLSGSGPYSYSGGTTVSGGTLAGTTTSLQGGITVNSGTTVDFDQTSTGTYAGAMTGTGSLTKSNTGTVILTGANGYFGGTTVTGGTLQVGADNNLGDVSGDVTLSGSGTLNTTVTFTSPVTRTFQTPDTGTFNVATGTTLTLEGVLQNDGADGEFIKDGMGTLVLTGTNTYTGGTTVSDGVLQGTTTGIQGDVLNNASVVFDQTTTGTYAGAMTGMGSLTKSNTGTVILTGANGYFGGTTVSGGVLQGTTTGIQGDVLNNASVVFDQTSTGTYAGVMSGTGSLTKSNTGTVTLSGANTYSGGTSITDGTLQVGSDTNLGNASGDVSLSNSGILNTSATFTSNRMFQSPDTGVLNVNGGTTLTLAGVLQDGGTPGEFVKEGTGTLILTGGNAYTGGTTVNAGVLQGTTTGIQGDVTNDASVVFDQTNAGTYAGMMSGTGSLTKSNTGTVMLSGVNTYSGGTSVTAGALQVEADSNLGDASGDVSLSNSGALKTTATFTSNRTFQSPDTGVINVDGGTTLTLTGVLQDDGTPGKFVKEGMGTLVQSGANTYSGGTTVTAGTLQVGSDTNLGDAAGGVTLSNSGALKTTATFTSNRTFQSPNSGIINVDGETTLTLAGVLQDDGTSGEFIKEGNGTLLLTGTNTFTGGTRVNTGVLQGTTTSLQGDMVNNASVIFDQTTTGTYADVMSGTGSLTKSNTGTVILSNKNTYSGETFITDGTLQISSDNNLGNASGNVSLSNSGILNTTATFTSNRTFQSPDTGILNVNGSTTLTLAGVLQDQGAPGEFVKEGMGTLILTGANTYSGGTSVTDGTLQVGADSNLGNAASDVTLSSSAALKTTATFTSNRTFQTPNTGVINVDGGTTLTLTGVLQDDGAPGKFVKEGMGTLTQSGSNTYSGGTSITDGTLQVSADDNLGSASGDVTLSNSGALNTTATFTSNRTFQSPDTGVLNIDGGTTLTLAGVLQDDGTPGAFVKEGMGTLLLTAANTYTGGTTISAGVLQGTTTSLQGNIGNNASVIFDQTTTGTYAGVMSGAGSLTKSNTGTVILTGVNSYSGGTSVTQGTLQISADHNLGRTSGAVRLTNSGVLNTTATFSSNRTFQTPNAGVFNVDGGTTLSLTGVLQDDGTPGQFIKDGAGTLVLTGTNTYSAGTIVNDGVLQGTTTGIQGDVTNGASVIFDQTTTGTYAGVMSGTGSLTKSNTGIVALTGTNTYSGGTSVTGGALQVEADSNLGDASGDVSLSNSGALKTTATFTSNRTFQSPNTGVFNVDGGTTLTLSGVLQDDGTPGRFTKNGEGTLVLSGSNTHSNGTTVSQGILQVGADNNLGNASGIVTLANSSVLNTTATFSSNRTFQTPDIGVFDVDGGTTLTLTGLLQDQGAPGKFFKEGTGTLVLTGANTYSNGTTVTGGVLQGTTTGIQGDVLNNASVVFDQTSNGTYSGVISGTGSLTKANTGTVILTGANSYSGGTMVNDGVLQGNMTSLQGVITNDATLVFNERGVKPFKGSLEGTGVLNKQNRGIVLLNGAHPFTGTTNLNVGGIRLHGSITGPVNVGVMGAFGGNAQTGDLTNAGLVVPGASIGTITVIGNYVQASTGNLAIQINDSGASDLLSATGTASLDGRLVVEALPGLYDGNETYTILTAVGGLGGTTFAQEFAIGNLIYQLNYLPNSVVLSNQYVGPILPIAPRDLKGNPKKVAEYLFCPGLVPTNPDLLNVMGALLNLSPDEFIAALDRLHPAQFGALPLVILQNSYTMANTMVSTTVNMHDCQTCQESSCPPQDGQTLVWVTPIGQWQSQKATDDQLGFNTQTYGGSAGVSHLFSSWINVALGGGYSHTDLGWKHNAGDGHWNSIYLGPSVGLIGGNWFVNFLAQGAVNFFSMDRKINFPGIKRTAHNTHHSYDILGRFDGGYQFVVQQPSPFFFVPTFRLGYLNIFEESYTESGADSINLAVDSKYSAFLQPEVLMRMRKEVYTGNLCIVPKFELGWISNIPLSSGNYTSSFYKQDLCSSDFSVRSFHDTTNQFVIGLGLTIIRMGNFQFDMGYQARLFDKVYINSAQLSFEKAF